MISRPTTIYKADSADIYDTANLRLNRVRAYDEPLSEFVFPLTINGGTATGALGKDKPVLYSYGDGRVYARGTILLGATPTAGNLGISPTSQETLQFQPFSDQETVPGTLYDPADTTLGEVVHLILVKDSAASIILIALYSPGLTLANKAVSLSGSFCSEDVRNA